MLAAKGKPSPTLAIHVMKSIIVFFLERTDHATSRTNNVIPIFLFSCRPLDIKAAADGKYFLDLLRGLYFAHSCHVSFLIVHVNQMNSF